MRTSSTALASQALTSRWLPTWGTLPALVALALLVAVPSVWSLALTLGSAAHGSAWAALIQHPQTWHALALSMLSGTLSTLLAVVLANAMLCQSFGRPSWRRLQILLAPLLATPHAAFAVGLVLLLAPSGWLLRLLSPWATGLHDPPAWPLTQDPWGLGLTLALVLKELPFLLWVSAAELQRPDVAARLQRDLQVAATLGYRPMAAWWRLGWPPLARRLRAPMLAVLAYGLGNVDMAMVAGPTTPPTLSVLAWQWLQDPDPTTNLQGASAAWLLASAMAVMVLLAHWISQRHAWRTWLTRGPQPLRLSLSMPLANTEQPRRGAMVASDTALAALYVAVLLGLLAASVMGPWPFPDLLAQDWTLHAWRSVAASADTLGITVMLGLGSALAALLWCLAWLEFSQPWCQQPGSARAITTLESLLMLPLILPAVLWVVGLHHMALQWGLEAHFFSVWLAHGLAVLPYVLLCLRGPYRSFDPRLRQVAHSLGHGRWGVWWRVQLPLLRTPLASAFAVGFAVSVAQYLPTLYLGGGRLNTVTTEAMALASGGQRSLGAAYAWLLWVLPVIVFLLAARLGRPRFGAEQAHRTG